MGHWVKQHFPAQHFAPDAWAGGDEAEPVRFGPAWRRTSAVSKAVEVKAVPAQVVSAQKKDYDVKYAHQNRRVKR